MRRFVKRGNLSCWRVFFCVQLETSVPSTGYHGNSASQLPWQHESRHEVHGVVNGWHSSVFYVLVMNSLVMVVIPCWFVLYLFDNIMEMVEGVLYGNTFYEKLLLMNLNSDLDNI